MKDLIAFYRARLDELEQAARQTTEEEYAWNVGVSTSYGSIDHAELHTPSWALRDVEAKRRIVDEYDEALRTLSGFRESGYEEGRREALELACRALALPYADHRDYQKRWKP